MSKLAEQLRTIGIFNWHDLCANGHPMIWRRVKSGSRDVIPSAWMLSIKGKIFKHRAWYDHGAMSFSDHGWTNWREAVAAPLAKCKELFPDLEMVKGPWPNTYVPKCDLDAAKAKLKEGNR